jgi:plastocyanin
MRVRLPSISCTALAAAVLLAGCGGGGGGSTPTSPSTGAPAPPATQTVTVNIVGSAGNSAYSPNPVSAAPGDAIVFRNSDGSVHHIVLDNGGMDFGNLTPGATSPSFTLPSAQPLTFHCVNHPSMVGAINGMAPDPPECSDPYGYGC